MSSERESARLDIWLWSARFFKTRALAKEAVERGRVMVNDAPAKPARLLHVDDRLSIQRGDERIEIGVVALANKRGSAAIAQALYSETEASVTAREAQRDARRLSGEYLEHPQKRPDKQARRALIDWKERGR